jgi:hypothetical protein
VAAGAQWKQAGAFVEAHTGPFVTGTTPASEHRNIIPQSAHFLLASSGSAGWRVETRWPCHYLRGPGERYAVRLLCVCLAADWLTSLLLALAIVRLGAQAVRMNSNSQWIGTASVDLTHSGYLASGTVNFTRQATPKRVKHVILTVVWWLGQVCTLRKLQCGRKAEEHSQHMGPTRTLAIRHATVDAPSPSMLLGRGSLTRNIVSWPSGGLLGRMDTRRQCCH